MVTSPPFPPELSSEASTSTMQLTWFQQFVKSGAVVSAGNGKVWAAWGRSRKSSMPELGKFSVYAPDFLLTEPKPWVIYEHCLETSAADLVAEIQVEAVEPSSWRAPNEKEFDDRFRDVRARIDDGTLLKAVPVACRSLSRPLSAKEKTQALRRALQVTKGFPMYVYGFWTSRDEGMIGATPEFLFRQRGEQLITMALAATRPVNSPRGSLLEDSKEVLEHQFVIDGIVERLTPIGKVNLGETQELELPTLVHLRTPIRVEPTIPVTFSEVVAALHPTPAIGAWPLEAGWKWLQSETNSLDRGRFGAPFGFIPPSGEDGECLVAIRNVQWSPNQATLYAGCGVVGPSKLGREWKEVNSKLDAIQHALGL